VKPAAIQGWWLASQFEQQHPDIHLRWVVLEENVLRQRVTTDIVTKAGQFDVLTVGNYEVPIWAKQGWLEPMDNLPASYHCCVTFCLTY
jgi:sorbitol/mannitol transport system substrate-binding protein